MLSDYGKFYKTALDVLNRLLETNQLSENQYWNAIRTLPLIEKHRSQLKLDEELTFLFVFATIPKSHPTYVHLEKIPKTFGVADSEIYLTVRDAMNIKTQSLFSFKYLERQSMVMSVKTRRTRSVAMTIDMVLDRIHNDALIKSIEGEIDVFIDQFSQINLKPTKNYFLVYLEKLVRKYDPSITKNYLCEIFDVDPTGWMKMQRKLIDNGILVKSTTNSLRYITPAKEILGTMYDYNILSDNQLRYANQLLEEIPDNYPRVLRDIRGVLTAFMAIKQSSDKDILDIAEMFTEFDAKSGNGTLNYEEREFKRREYYEMFHRTISET